MPLLGGVVAMENRGSEPFGTGGDTHTLRLMLARAKSVGEVILCTH